MRPLRTFLCGALAIAMVVIPLNLAFGASTLTPTSLSFTSVDNGPTQDGSSVFSMPSGNCEVVTVSTSRGWISVPTPALTEGGGTESTTVVVTVDPSHSSLVTGNNLGSVTVTPLKNNGDACREGSATLDVTLTITADTTAPSISCGSADSSWHAANVSIACTASDSGSGLANSGDASFSLATTVADEAETSTASTGSRSVCDSATPANCATAGPITGNKIDRKDPTTITFVGLITDGASYEEGLFVPPAPTCTALDGGSGLQSCVVTGYSSAVGSHTLTATATDAVGNSSTGTLGYTITQTVTPGNVQPLGDSTSPNTFIDSGPQGSVSGSSATFTYSGNDAGTLARFVDLFTPSDLLTFECRMDGSAFAPCPSIGMTYAALEDGSHTFDVRATDTSRNVDQSPASRTFVIDQGAGPVIDPPDPIVTFDTAITSGPRGTITERSVTFTYSFDGTSDAALRMSGSSDIFECRMDAGSFKTCSRSGVTYSGLDDGTYRFQVRGIDGSGNADATPAARTFEVDADQVLGDLITNDSKGDDDSPAGDDKAGSRNRKPMPFTGARLQGLVVFALLSIGCGAVLTRRRAHECRESVQVAG